MESRTMFDQDEEEDNGEEQKQGGWQVHGSSLTSKNELEMGVTYHFLFTETRGRMQMAVLPSDA